MGEVEMMVVMFDVEIGGFGGEVMLVDLFLLLWVELYCEVVLISEFFEESGFVVVDQDFFELILIYELDWYVDVNIEFDDWQVMFFVGVECYVFEQGVMGEVVVDVVDEVEVVEEGDLVDVEIEDFFEVGV